jgi:nitrite reductase (NADH) small subunit
MVYQRLGRIEEITTGSSKTFRVGNREIAVFHYDGKYFALKNMCPHHGLELHTGSVTDKRVKCPGHGFSFDLETGECDRDRTLCASTFEVRVESGELFVRI